MMMLSIVGDCGRNDIYFILIGRNVTLESEFVLLGFSFMPHFAIPFFFFLILVLYLFSMAGNLLILTLVFSDQQLHSPMYLFLCNLSILDICFINTTVPKMLQGFLPGGKTISLLACFAQSYTFFFLGVSTFFLLAIMSFDRFVAICHPLHYPAIMHQKLCIKLIASVFILAFLVVLIPSIRIMRLPFCSNLVNHFFCDVIPLLMNSCINTSSIQLQEIVASSITLISSLLVTLISYVYIVKTILNIPSIEGRKKTFSTCSSHALVVSLAYGSCIFTYIKPTQGQFRDYDKMVAILTTVIVPLLNPYVYTLRNEKVRKIIKKNYIKNYPFLC